MKYVVIDSSYPCTYSPQQGDTVAVSIADRLGVSKADLLTAEADNVAVRLALAEAQLVAETKAFLKEQGISMDTFAKKERSDMVILEY
ncbi:hypothetical protein BC937DRAFT_94608 [Endogone sp. FLAS-F59071]|nr:hypothetical protein BC937DRAFT_94608 [Endogone sp. FLAS-F59071]|eukprot:RUS13911.1 hypothetical protein BC937DRAFT_94608 [Endogone sp. FLAS-F59071]